MISLLSTILSFSYEAKIRLPKMIIRFLHVILTATIAALAVLVVIGLCSPMIAVLDLAAAITIIILLLLKFRSE